eukprot:gene8820-50399_t
MLSVDADGWAAVLRRWLLDPPRVCCAALPSADAADAVREEERARVAATRAALGNSPHFRIEGGGSCLGDDGLRRRGEEAAAHTEANERPVPASYDDALPSPTLESVRFFPCATWRTLDPPSAEGAAVKAAVDRFDSVNTRFVEVTAYLSLHIVDPRRAQLIGLLCVLLF